MPYTGGGSGGSTPGPAPILGYRHLQTLPAAVWTIVHHLGFRPAGVQVSDEQGNPVEGVVTHPDLNQTVITFSVPLAGIADLS